MPGFIFGESTPWDYDTLQSKRKVAEQLALANSRTPQNVGEGLAAIGRALAYRRINKRAATESERLQGEFDAQFDALFGPVPQTVSTMGAGVMGQADGALPASLIATESGGNFGASNDVMGHGGMPGHFGRGQFGQARLQEAFAAGVVPEMTPEQFMASPDAQRAVEAWHVQDINKFIRDRGLDQYVGQTINGVPVTPTGMLAVAHLGGKGGLERFLTTRGQYNPSDANGTSLLDYLGTHGGATPANHTAPAGPDPQRMRQIASVLSNPMASEGQRAIASALLQQEMARGAPREREIRNDVNGVARYVDTGEPVFGVEREPEYNLLTDEEEAALGLPTEGVYQRNRDGRISAVGGSQVEVNVGEGSSEYTKSRNKSFAEQMGEIEAAEDAARRALTALDVMEGAMSSPGFYSGAGGDTVLALKRLGRAMGLDVEGIDSIESFNGQAKQAALDVMGGSLGAGFSNADRDFVMDQVPNLDNTPEGNAEIIRIQRAIQTRKVEIASMARAYEAEHGQIDSGFRTQLSEWAEENPLFEVAPSADGGEVPDFGGMSDNDLIGADILSMSRAAQDAWEAEMKRRGYGQ